MASIGNALSGSFADFRVYFANDFDMLRLRRRPARSARFVAKSSSSLAGQLRRVGLFGTADVEVRKPATGTAWCRCSR